MKKILAILSVVILFSCSKDDNTVNSVIPAPDFKIKKISSENSTSTFYYNNDKLDYIETTSLEGNYRYQYVYENNKIIKEKKFIEGVYQSNNDLNFVYDGSNIISQTGYEDNILFKHEFSYNQLNQMISDKQFDDNVFNSEETLTYFEDGNIKSVQYENSSKSYTYDNKINPIYYTLGESLSKINKVSKNNFLTENENYIYQYEYNSNNLPSKITTKSSTGNIYQIKNIEYY